jgi:hypothetical protein
MHALLALLLGVTFLAQAAPSAAPSTSAGDVAFAAGDFGAAYAGYTAALAANPNDPDAVLGLGTIDLYRNDLKPARSYLELARTLLPAEPRVARAFRTLAAREGNLNDYRIAMSAAEARIPFIATDPLPVFHATINGQDALVMLDTGAAGVDLSADGAARLHIATHVIGQGIFAGGKTAQVSAGYIDSVAFNGVTVRGIPSNVIPQPLSMGGRTIDGIVGTVFLSHFLATIDYVDGALILRPRSTSVQFERDLSAGASRIPMWLVGDHFIFARANVGHAPESLFNIDTGGGGLGVQLTKASLEAAHIDVDKSNVEGFGGGGGEAPSIPFTAPSVTLGRYTVQNVPGLYFPEGDQYGVFPFHVAGTLSHLFFRKTTLTFDFDAMQLIVGA